MIKQQQQHAHNNMHTQQQAHIITSTHTTTCTHNHMHKKQHTAHTQLLHTQSHADISHMHPTTHTITW